MKNIQTFGEASFDMSKILFVGPLECGHHDIMQIDVRCTVGIVGLAAPLVVHIGSIRNVANHEDTDEWRQMVVARSDFVNCWATN